MNNSGFWIFSKMGGMTTGETLRSWSMVLAAIGIVGLLIILGLSTVLPLV
jgi:H+/gluconate symporter-like permease